MAVNNHELVGRLLDNLREGLGPAVLRAYHTTLVNATCRRSS